MKPKDLSLAYCKYNSLALKDGELKENDPAPILPFLIMDCAYQEFCSQIKPLPMRHAVKRARTLWLADYKAFNRRLFVCLDAEQGDYAIELMDRYGDFIADDALRVKVAVMDLVSGCEFADQKAISSLMLCNIFCQIAQITWGLIFNNTVCPELTRMRNTSHHLCNGITLLPDDVHTNEDVKLNKAVNVLMTRTSAWLKSFQDND